MENRCIAFLYVILSVLYVSSAVEVHTNVGTILGITNTVTVKGTDYPVKTFLGIPYAKPPTGDRRFQKPEAVDPFDKPFEALSNGYACPQNLFTGVQNYTSSEDCLYLNIYVPDQIPDQGTGHPVMVFIHGGGFTVGSGESFVGDKLASFGNVIMVAINYRLGVFGFLDSGDGRVPGNLGLHDQHMALKWVNRNIGGFGGDANRVTLFGESAGGSSVMFQSLYPDNRGLYQRTICESGVISARPIIAKNTKEPFDAFCKAIGCHNTVNNGSLDCIKSVNISTILEKLLGLAGNQSAQFLPTIDGEIIKIAPYHIAALSESRVLDEVEFFRSLDVMIGFNNYEGAMFLPLNVYPFEDNITFHLPREDFQTKAVPGVMSNVYGGPVPDALNSIVASEYTNWENPESPEYNRDQYVKIWSDTYYTVGSVEFTRLHANSSVTSNSYAYLFTALPSNRLIKTPDWIKGATHTDELNYVFMFDDELNRMVEDKKPFADWEYELSYRMVTYWTNFAKSGNPNMPVKVSPRWPDYDLFKQQYINLNRDMSDRSIQNYLYSREADFWLKTIPEVMKELSSDHDTA